MTGSRPKYKKRRAKEYYDISFQEGVVSMNGLLVLKRLFSQFSVEENGLFL